MAPLKGVHRVRMRLAAGYAEYWYAWRGGPRILAVVATSERLREVKVAAEAEEAGRRFYEIQEARRTPAKGLLGTLALEWAGTDDRTASPEFLLLADRTRKDLRKHLAIVRQDLGTMPIRALEAAGMRKVLITWRNRYAEHPRQADHYASALSQLLLWARDQGVTAADPMRSWPWIYRVDRSGVVWPAEELEAICAASIEDPELQVAILGAAYSGLRKGDLLVLTKTAIGADKITRRTRKRRRVVDVPITPAFRQVLDAAMAISPADSPYVFTKDGRPWKESTLDKHFSSARAKAAQKIPVIAGKRWHDLRGSYATLLIRAGVRDGDVDQIMGWKKGNAELTRASYVSGSVVAELAIERLKRFTDAA